MAKCAWEFRGFELEGREAAASIQGKVSNSASEMGPLGTHTSIYLSSHPQPRKAEPHSFREKVFRKKAPVCAVCKVTIDGTGVSCRGEVLFLRIQSPPLNTTVLGGSRNRQAYRAGTNALTCMTPTLPQPSRSVTLPPSHPHL